MAMHRAEFDANFAEAAKQAEYMLKQREPLFAMDRAFFDINPKTGESNGYYYWGTVARRDYYKKLADLTTGKTGDMIAVLPEQGPLRPRPARRGPFRRLVRAGTSTTRAGRRCRPRSRSTSTATATPRATLTWAPSGIAWRSRCRRRPRAGKSSSAPGRRERGVGVGQRQVRRPSRVPRGL